MAGLIIVSGFLTVGDLAYRWQAKRKKVALMFAPALFIGDTRVSRWPPPGPSKHQSAFSAKGTRSMMKFRLLILPLFARLTACQSTTRQSVCDGCQKLRPSLKTTVTMLRTDRPFADQKRHTIGSAHPKAAGSKSEGPTARLLPDPPSATSGYMSAAGAK
ncbi:putative exported or membrane-anchored protein [Rhizobium grahamii CCGE 502]|uniref:Putative exported or membrane-anchored protein n=1 Tax=Rhizobium grahamii CCGE 502 TaxID=990285 RepID=S3ICT5_9HYPH|nr:putative exported or membrane-anchored protein [Rhizobium grahamii CCGE 502]